MSVKRTDRLNSLLKEVISDVIRHKVRNPDVHPLLTVTRVDITKDLKYAKVYISVLSTELEKQRTLEALQSAAGFIGVHASKEVVLRFFPSLTFKLDDSVDKQMRINDILAKIRNSEKNESSDPS